MPRFSKRSKDDAWNRSIDQVIDNAIGQVVDIAKFAADPVVASTRQKFLSKISQHTQGNSSYEFTRDEVLEPDSHRKFNKIRTLGWTIASTSLAASGGAFMEIVFLDFNQAVIWGASSLVTGAASVGIFSRWLPRLDAKIWSTGTNRILQQLVVTQPVSITEDELRSNVVVKELSDGGRVVFKTKKPRARLAGPNDVVGSIVVKYPENRGEDFDLLLDSLYASDPEVARALDGYERKQLRGKK